MATAETPKNWQMILDLKQRTGSWVLLGLIELEQRTERGVAASGRSHE